MREPVVDKVLEFLGSPTEEGFEPLALEVFDFQYQRNSAYRQFCDRRGATPATVSSWKEIPPMPTVAFKELDLCCGLPTQIFLTSGTTQGQGRRGRHGFPWLEIYHASLLANFADHLLSDRVRLPMLILAPSPDLLPHSSLSHMLEVVRKTYGKEGGGYFAEQVGLDLPGILQALTEAEEQGEPVCLLGTSFAFVHLLDFCQKEGRTFRLAGGSRLMDTGGYKGRSREVPREELYRRYHELLGIAEPLCVNEYGMTEMGSQFYDNTLRNSIVGREHPRYKEVPPWVRTRIIEPLTFEDLPEGRMGVLVHYDLANCGSVMAIQTEDLGYRIQEGFELIGRVQGAEARGCSLTIEELQEIS
jgi:hypothetical protein